MHLDLAVIPVPMIFPLAVLNVVFAPIWGKKVYCRVFLEKLSQKRLLRTVKGKVTLHCSLLGSVEAFLLRFLVSVGPS